MLRYGDIESGNFIDAIRKNWRNFVNYFSNLPMYYAVEKN